MADVHSSSNLVDVLVRLRQADNATGNKHWPYKEAADEIDKWRDTAKLAAQDALRKQIDIELLTARLAEANTAVHLARTYIAGCSGCAYDPAHRGILQALDKVLRPAAESAETVPNADKVAFSRLEDEAIARTKAKFHNTLKALSDTADDVQLVPIEAAVLTTCEHSDDGFHECKHCDEIGMYGRAADNSGAHR